MLAHFQMKFIYSTNDLKPFGMTLYLSILTLFHKVPRYLKLVGISSKGYDLIYFMGADCFNVCKMQVISKEMETSLPEA